VIQEHLASGVYKNCYNYTESDLVQHALNSETARQIKILQINNYLNTYFQMIQQKMQNADVVNS